MSDFIKVLILDNEIEASIMEDILDDREIPHLIQSYNVKGFDGVFQLHQGWGHIEAEEEYMNEIIEIYNDLKQSNFEEKKEE
ncbi:MAG: hypothetical protein K9K32_06365 [Halanaerobiales bacterium]|nr:hypothetical protein [Halanaerobiales bacterium]